MAAYVEGEAPETDSEDEQYLFNLSYMKVKTTIWKLKFNLKCFHSKIGSENAFESPNVAISNTKDLLLKGNIVDGLTNDEDLLNTPVATEITEDFSMYPSGDPATPAEFFYENELLRRKISKIFVLYFQKYTY